MSPFFRSFCEGWKESSTASRWHAVFSLLVLSVCAASPVLAQTVQTSPVNPTGFLTKVIDLLTGTTATALAIIAVVIIGFGAMFGMFDFRKVGWLIVGIIFVFGAAWIVQSITGTSL